MFAIGKVRKITTRSKAVIKKLGWIGVCTIAIGGSFAVYQIIAVSRRFTNILPAGVHDLNKEGPSYIYPTYQDVRETEGEVPREAMLVADDQVSTQWQTLKKDIPVVYLPGNFGPAFPFWQLLHTSKSNVPGERLHAVEKLSQIGPLYDSDYIQIAQASDARTAVGLARSKRADLRLLLKPPTLPESKEPYSIEKGFRDLLASLPDTNVDDCVTYLTREVLEKGHFFHTADKQDWYLGNDVVMRGKTIQRVPEETMEIFYLEALLGHSLIPEHKPLIVERNGLQLLMALYNKRKNKPHVKNLIGQIIGNLAMDEKTHEDIVRSGWVKVLAKWMRTNPPDTCLPAARALANVDRDGCSVKYLDGVYLMYPLYRTSEAEEPTADIVFVHGLTGGAFRTWRQRDIKAINPHPDGNKTADTGELNVDVQFAFEDIAMKSKDRSTDPPKLNEKLVDGYQQDYMDWLTLMYRSMTTYSTPYTYCWPKDWLPRDCPGVRVIGVDFDSQLSEWFRKCPMSSENRTIASRSKQLLQRLLEAGIGKKPIIWVAHSMGGLLVKSMLLLADESDDPEVKSLAKNTQGIIFFSVPHRGSALASSLSVGDAIFQIASEVQELKLNASPLLKLHLKFEEFVNKEHVNVMSFGETLKTRIGLSLDVLFVDPSSSDPGFGEFYTVATNHINVCKPVSRRSRMYLRILEFIYENTPHTVFEIMLKPRVPKFREITVDEFLDFYMNW